MSNARSPRDVCSTTIGTSGLTVLASFRFEYSNPSTSATARRRSPGRRLATGPWGPDRVYRPVRRSGIRRPQLTAGGLVGPGRPQLVARLRLLDGDRRGRLRDQVERLALPEVVLERVEPAVGAQPL